MISKGRTTFQGIKGSTEKTAHLLRTPQEAKRQDIDMQVTWHVGVWRCVGAFMTPPLTPPHGRASTHNSHVIIHVHRAVLTSLLFSLFILLPLSSQGIASA